jgi:hypothetical protein
MAGDDFMARIDALRRMTGMPGSMTGVVVVDQILGFTPITSTKT